MSIEIRTSTEKHEDQIESGRHFFLPTDESGWEMFAFSQALLFLDTRKRGSQSMIDDKLNNYLIDCQLFDVQRHKLFIRTGTDIP